MALWTPYKDDYALDLRRNSWKNTSSYTVNDSSWRSPPSTPDSGCSTGSLSPKSTRPFKQMTEGISLYYKSDDHPSMRRNFDRKDTSLDYAEKRKKNNEAAKRSRDLRKLKEDELAIRVACLEAKYYTLRSQLDSARMRR